MKKISSLLIMFFFIVLLGTACSPAPEAPVEDYEDVPVAAPDEEITMSIYNNVYLGEAFNSGYVYLEPFCLDRETYNEESYISGHPDTIRFVSLGEGNTVYTGTYDDKFGMYVPEKEQNSVYYSQEFSKPMQYGLRYKLQEIPSDSIMGLTVFDYAVENCDTGIKGKARTYSDEEYQEAQALLKKDHEIAAENRTLDYITLDNTIAGAKQLCRISFRDNGIELLLSVYNTHDAEYAARVYVLDIIKDGAIIRTFQKYNWDGPY